MPTRASKIDETVASALGFPKQEYIAVEIERRWLCQSVPRHLIRQSEEITDLYVDGTRLRLREARPIEAGAPMLRLSRKADIDAYTRLITSIYLPEDEFAVLARLLPGARIKKLRHRLQSVPGAELLVDEFQDALAGLILAEAAFEGPEQMAAFEAPDFALREVTTEPRYTGGHLVKFGVPT
jgi:CYTH domain-containing protein